MAGTQPMLDDNTQIELLTQLSDGVIAQTLGPVMFDQYLNDIKQIHGGGTLHVCVQAGSSSETMTKHIIIKRSGNVSPILDVIAKTDGRGNILSQHFGNGNGDVKFASPIFFFSSSGEVGVSIMEAVPGMTELDPFNPDIYKPISFNSRTITCYFFIGEIMQFTLEIPPDRDTQKYGMDLGLLIDKLVDGFCNTIAKKFDASNGDETIVKLMKHLADMGEWLEDMFLLGILPVSAADYVVLLQWPAGLRFATQSRSMWAGHRFDAVQETTRMQREEGDGHTEWMDASEDTLDLQSVWASKMRIEP